MNRLWPRERRAGAAFAEAFGGAPETVWTAPGRVNLIGEHTDYNDGLCLPLAIGFGIDCAAALTDDGLLRAVSAQRPGEVAEIPLAGLAPGTTGGWAAYVAGVLWVLQQRGVPVPGVRVAVDSDLPEGAGLSSSAALECAVLGAVAELTAVPLEGQELPRLAQQAENQFVGVPCGLMDQLVSALGQQGHVLLFDARSGEARPVPLALHEHGLELVVVDTQSAHALVDGGYAERRDQCHEAARVLGVPSLREAGDLAALSGVLLQRARHVVTEIARVEHTVRLLQSGEVEGIGALMTASHASLRDDFQVTVPELDVAVEVALSAGALGARMTGGGFGGSVIALVAHGSATTVAEAVAAAFAERGFTEPRWFAAAPEAGARRLGGPL